MFSNPNKTFAIIAHPRLYKDDQYSISYRLVILHGLHKYLRSEGGDIKNITMQMEKIVTSAQGSFYQKNCSELITFEKNSKVGFVLIDRSKACYPLIFYPEDNNPDHKDRVSALKTVVLEINSKCKSFESILQAFPKWNNELVATLKSNFNMPRQIRNNL